MEVLQKFQMKLDRLEGLLFVEVSRSPNMNGFLHKVSHQVPGCNWEMRHPYFEHVELSDEETQRVMDQAARLWDDYWTVGIEGETHAQGWQEWLRGRKTP